MVGIVKCVCECMVYNAGEKKMCPECSRVIFKNDSESYIINDSQYKIPVLNVYKFDVSELNYFNNVYPKIGYNVVVIMENGKAIFNFKWTYDERAKFELGDSKIFSWLIG